MTNFNILLFIFFLFISIKKTEQSSSLEIQIIPDAYLNATAAFVLLENFKDSDYVYFSYDFDYHNNVNPNDLNIAYFKITTELYFFVSDFKYIFLDKKQIEVNPTDLDSKNLIWMPCYPLYSELIDNDFNYYIRSIKFGKKKVNKKNFFYKKRRSNNNN